MGTAPETTVITREHFFSEMDLIEKAARSLEIDLCRYSGKTSKDSVKLATYPITDELLAAMEKRGIKKFPHRCKDMFTIDDTTHTTAPVGWAPSSYWNFKTDEEHKLEFEVSLHFELSEEERGVICYPRIRGNFLSPADQPPFDNMLGVFAEMDPNLHPVLAAAFQKLPDRIVVPWGDLGLGGIRHEVAIFHEMGFSKTAEELFHTYHSPLDPNPFPQWYAGRETEREKNYLPEKFQAALKKQWRKQFEDYRASLK